MEDRQKQTNQVEAYDCSAACYGADCDVHDVISVMRIYDDGDSR